MSNRKFKITGCLAHQSRPKQKIDFSKTIEAHDIISAWYIYERKLKGIKKRELCSITEVL